MSITINTTAVTINNENISFEDIYQKAVTDGKTNIVSKLGNSYLITSDLVIKGNSTLTDTNKFITINGDLIQIEKGSLLHIGILHPNGATTDGCTISAPNIKLIYGFGNTTKTYSGDFKAFGSTINIFGFWSFFEGTNTVQIINCFVDGFGRIAGTNSILKNIIFKQSHGQYGVLSPKGDLQEMSGLSVYDSKTSGAYKCSLYHNPTYAPDLTIYYGTYAGYDTLAYLESGGTAHSHKLTLLGSDVIDGYTLFREDSSIDFYHKFRFNPKLMKPDGSSIINANFVIKDNTGTTEFTGNTDLNGDIDCWLTYYQDIAPSTTSIRTPHTMEITSGTDTVLYTIIMDKNYNKFPLIFSVGGSGGVGTVDYDRIQAMITAAKDETITVVSDGNTNINQVLIALGDEVDVNQAIIEGKNGAKMFL